MSRWALKNLTMKEYNKLSIISTGQMISESFYNSISSRFGSLGSAVWVLCQGCSPQGDGRRGGDIGNDYTLHFRARKSVRIKKENIFECEFGIGSKSGQNLASFQFLVRGYLDWPSDLSPQSKTCGDGFALCYYMSGIFHLTDQYRSFYKSYSTSWSNFT